MSFRAKRSCNAVDEVHEARLSISDHLFRLPRVIIKLWLLFSFVAEIQPSWIHFLDKGNLPGPAPTFQFLLARDRVVDIAKVLDPNKSDLCCHKRRAILFVIPMYNALQRLFVRM